MPPATTGRCSSDVHAQSGQSRQRALEAAPTASALFLQHGLEVLVLGVDAQAQDVQLTEALLAAADGLDLLVDSGVDLHAHDDPRPRIILAAETGGQQLAGSRERVVIGDGDEA